MKKVLALVLIAVFVGCTAFAAEIKPFAGVDMAQSLDDSILSVGFTMENVSEKGIVVDVYNEQRYDAVEVINLQPGDIITCMGEDVTVETVEEDYSILVNGGSEKGGVTLCPDEGGTYIALNYETPLNLMVGQAEFPFADEVSYSHWQQDAEGNILDEMAVQTVPASRIVELLSAESGEGAWPLGARIVVEGGYVTEIIFDYAP